MLPVTVLILSFHAGQFTVVTPPQGQPGVVMLQNVNWGGLYIAIKGGNVYGNVRRLPKLIITM